MTKKKPAARKGKEIAEEVTSPDRPRLRNSVLILWLLLSLYVGMTSWTKINFDNLLARAEKASALVNCDDPAHEWFEYKGTAYCVMEEVYAEQQLELMEQLSLDWIFYLPDPLPLILSAFAFGVVGSLIRFLRNWLYQKNMPNADAAWKLPIMGGTTAIMLLGVSYVFPGLFAENNVLLKPEVQPFLSIFAGVFAEHLQKWFQVMMEKNFSTAKENG